MAYPAAAVAALILLGAGVGGALFADGRMAYDAWPHSPEPDVPKRVPAPAPPVQTSAPATGEVAPGPEKPRGKGKKGQTEASGKPKHKANGA